MPYLSASAVVIHYEEALYQVYGPLPFTFTFDEPESEETEDLRLACLNILAYSAVFHCFLDAKSTVEIP